MSFNSAKKTHVVVREPIEIIDLSKESAAIIMNTILFSLPK